MSRTLAAIGPAGGQVAPTRAASRPPTGTRPSDGFMPEIPHTDDGMRIEPPPSEPVHSGTRPAAMAAAEPPDEPPALRVRSHGLAVAPKSGFTVSALWPPSGVLVLPTTMHPAAFSRSTSGESVVGDRAVGVDRRALRGAEAGGVLEVLHADRDAGERSDVLPRRQARVDGRGVGQGPLPVDGDERVDLGVDLLDAARARRPRARGRRCAWR